MLFLVGDFDDGRVAIFFAEAASSTAHPSLEIDPIGYAAVSMIAIRGGQAQR